MATLTTSYQLLGSVKTSTYSQLRLYGKYNSQSTDNNTSSVSLQLRLYGNGGQGSFSSGTAKISGTSYSLGNTSYSKNAEKTLCTKTYTATHSSDGTYTASISYSISTTGTVSGSSSASITLPQIKRTSVLGNISDFTFGNSIPITYTEYVSSYTANLNVIIGSTTVKSVTNISSGTSISFTSGELNTIYGLVPNATTTSVTFQLVTMNGSTQIGTNSKSATGTIPSSVKPTISSVVLEDSLGYKQQIGNYVQHKSKIHGTISSSGGTGSGISLIETQINGETIYGNNFYTKELATSGTNSYTVRVTDTRGRSATYTGSFSVMSYSAPTINFNVYRSNSSGNQDDNGNYICINANASIDSLNNENTKEFKIEYRQGGGSWTTLTTYNTSYNYVLTNSVYSGFSSSYPFDVRLTATDRFGSQYAQVWIPTAKTVLDFYHDGTGVAIGKVADTSNKFDVAYNTEIESNLTVDGNITASGNSSVGGNLTVSGTAQIQNGLYCRPTGQANTPVGNSMLVIKRVTNSEAPNNGVVLEFGNSTSWTGQLYIGDNATQGIYYNGWSNGVRGSWIRLASQNDLQPVTLWEGTFTATSTSSITWTTSKYNFKTLRIAYKLDNWGDNAAQFVDIPNNKTGMNNVNLSLVYGYNSSRQQIRNATLDIYETSAKWESARIQHRDLSTNAVTAGGNAASSVTISVIGIYGLYY